MARLSCMSVAKGSLLLVAIIVIAGLVWRVHDQSRKPYTSKLTANSSTNSTPETSEKPSSNQPHATSTNQQSAATTNQVTERIPELGIQITVPASIKDLK